MGCCMSHYSFFEKETVHEVTLDANGVAQRVPKGQGTHFIHISPNNETHLEEKVIYVRLLIEHEFLMYIFL
ncbi:unnamed protein product [Mucor hiemalis]